MPNWKTSGLDFVQGFWLKNFKSIQESLRRTLKKKCLENRNVLMQKDKEKGKTASNDRPITCLPLVWKLLTGIIARDLSKQF